MAVQKDRAALVQALLATWAIAGSPLFFDGDCRRMDAATLALLTATEVPLELWVGVPFYTVICCHR